MFFNTVIMKRLAIMATCLMITGCAGFQSVESLASTQYAQTSPGSQSTAATSPASAKLNRVFQQYKGTPYRYGGTDASGFDCSGFINAAYAEAFDLSLPRTTEQLAARGTPVRRDQLNIGDIIFFQTSVKQLHAGIYTGDGNFIHSSSSKGVSESSLDNQYWHYRYLKAKRFL